MSDKDDAALALAKVREAHSPDEEGRQQAARDLLKQLLEACDKAKIKRAENDNVPWVSLSHPATKIWLAVWEGQLMVGPNREHPDPFTEGIEYNPLTKAFVATDLTGPGAVTLLALHVAKLLDEQGKAVAKGRRQPDATF